MLLLLLRWRPLLAWLLARVRENEAATSSGHGLMIVSCIGNRLARGNLICYVAQGLRSGAGSVPDLHQRHGAYSVKKRIRSSSEKDQVPFC